ncbi:carbohydrate ABC transporter substrate-binding protein [Enterocloster clostridioformis]|uniref:5'-nucleotidase C-terminal domain-containing protein n=1 Tax=Enterocloster clostridioformis TaxID=1531 RepID=UPI00080C99CE|nr:5'-nucleotidase C-terminal domain-containing protein [Enterocloster clostridioformis]ANU45488.1 hypothetical protein A4V08_06280 [Lachnoclostridium sp. YL32]NDO32196.1 carbohydrate ABC transporter substrate-binding protein [Enterocloster clostridioformis]OXE61548.1 carbohydrate ABC transporter substrate-binding protein [Enterocloster clostridioformis]QQQ99751.1 carbohydrate ABC transporter substrate-binding protein [Enterocloster clostridioformis]
MKKRCTALLAASALFLSLLTGCGLSPAEGGSAREKVTIALWSDQLTEGYGQYLQKMFPDVDFEFYVATNSTDFYRFKQSRGDLPDILTVRRFSLNDVADWKDALLDLSDTELAGTFHPSYLHSYTYSDGTVNWLPLCAEVDGIIVNKTLLEDRGLSVPSNYAEFAETCGALRELGIRPFISNYGADYTCMEILQGLSIPQLTSQAGREWRQQYESGQTEHLSEEVWMPVFERITEFIDYAGITADDMTNETVSAFNAYRDGEAAMVRGTGFDAARYSTDRESVLMPYYGEQAEESPERKALIVEILSAMLSEGGQRRVSSSQNMVPYNEDVTIDLSPSMSALQPYIDDNHLYIRLAPSEMFSISQKVVQGMISGEYPDARSAFDAFNEAMGADRQEEPAAAHIDTGYSYAFSPQGGSKAASAVMNTVREEVGTQLLIAPCVSVAGNIAAGDYTESELRFLTMGESPGILLCEMTGEQIYQYVSYALTTQGKQGAVINDASLYVSSGFEMEVQKTKDGYALVNLTVDGQELNRSETYSVAILGNVTMMLEDALEAAGVKDYSKWNTAYKQIIVDRLMEGRQLAAPTDYITLH